MLSFIVPAHNEEVCLPRTLEAIHESARAIGQPYEIIVVDDASTDATPDIARQHKARVVSVNHRQISATRNSGARAARGERFFFVDADTLANPRVVAAALREMDNGAVGGGAPTIVDKNDPIPLYGRVLMIPVRIVPKIAGFCGGAFMFCTREAFAATGGFNERVFFGEEGFFALALKREGRFAGLWETAITSGRRLRKLSGFQMLLGAVRILISPVKMLTQRVSVEKVWYDSNRSDDDKMPNSFLARVSNGVALLFVVVALTEPLWTRLPWSLTPVHTLLGNLRLTTALLLCHLGVLLCWPVAIVLLVNLLRQKRWTGVIQSTLLIAFCLWNAWGATGAVIWMWKRVCQWLV